MEKANLMMIFFFLLFFKSQEKCYLREARANLLAKL